MFARLLFALALSTACATAPSAELGDAAEASALTVTTAKTEGAKTECDGNCDGTQPCCSEGCSCNKDKTEGAAKEACDTPDCPAEACAGH
jgi:hypothetical protein